MGINPNTPNIFKRKITMALKKRYRRKPHSVSLLHAHLVFATKYRRRVLTPRVFDILKRSVAQSSRAPLLLSFHPEPFALRILTEKKMPRPTHP
jgi:hypothetical protein